MNHRFRHAYALMALSMLVTPAHAAPLCATDVDNCVRELIVENAGFVGACGAAFPAAKTLFSRAFKGWPVLKLPIPGLGDLLKDGSTISINAEFSAAEVLRQMTPEDRSAACSARLAMWTQSPPSLSGNTLLLPADALNRYSH
jgi:hypothetical protein